MHMLSCLYSLRYQPQSRARIFSAFSQTRPRPASATSRAVHIRSPIGPSAYPPRRTYYGHITDNKMAPQLEPFYKEVDGMAEYFIKRLEDAVAIPSISSDVGRRPDVVKMGHFLHDQLKALGADVKLHPLGKQDMEGVPKNEWPELPPLVLARYGNDKSKKTVLVYGHYDVQPAAKADGWTTEPFKLTIDAQGRMYGRGSTDDKGPVLGWLNVIEAHKKAGIEFPVNLLCCFEGMEEYGSNGLDDFVKAEAKGYFADADAVCISDNYWLGTEKPCVTYGLRGCQYYSIEVSGPGADLHSGVFGGTVQEPMTDLVRILAKLVDTDGKILIPGVYEMVEKVTPEEAALYPNIAFKMDDIYEAIKSKTTIYDNKVDTLMGRWRFPSLSIHGIQGAFSDKGAKTVIPAKVVGKFSIRTVPDMDSNKLDAIVIQYIKDEFAKLKSKNTCNPFLQHGGPWWRAKPDSWNFRAASKAVKQVFGTDPDMTREGGSIPVTNTFADALQRSVLLLPMGSSTDAAHSVDEKLDRKNYIEGTKLLGTYLHYIAAEPKD